MRFWLNNPKKKYGIESCKFENGVVAEFAGFDFSMSWDTYFDSDGECLVIPVFFKFPDTWDDNTIHCAISFEYSFEDEKVHIWSVDEESMMELYGKEFLKFGSRKDAMSIVNALKKLDLKSEITRNYTQEKFENYQDAYKLLLSKIKINEIFVS